jgi:hypothetical protein
MDDPQIASALASLPDVTPLSGEFEAPPFKDRVIGTRVLAVLSDDPGICALLVDRSTGEVVLLDPEGRVQAVNASLPQFVACAQAFERACREADALEATHDDHALDELGHRTRDAFAAIDRSAVASDEQLWSVRAEELGVGL